MPFIGGMRVEDITPEHCERWTMQLGTGRELSNRTKLKVMMILFGDY